MRDKFHQKNDRKLEEDLLYNQSCKKDPHVAGQDKKEKDFGMGLELLKGEKGKVPLP